VDETGKILGAQQRAKGTKMHAKRRFVKLTTIQLPFLCFAVERRVKNKFCLLLPKKDTSLKFLLRKENVPRDPFRIMNGDKQRRPGESYAI
jgi:hypothetical protein